MTRRLRLAVLAFLVATAITSLAASPQRAVLSGANDAPLTATVPVDPRITVGTLPNGLRYYIRANKQPQDRAELRLVVNAGSVLEDDDQRGLAHFVEHMCFNGTRHFPEAGRRRLPAVDRHALRRARQRQHQLRPDGLPAADSDRQPGRHRSLAAHPGGLGARRLVRAARRSTRSAASSSRNGALGLGAGARMLDAQLPVLLKDSRYAERLPIGKPEIIRTVPVRSPEEVLHRLVPARPDGGDRRRRLRSGRRSKR